MFNHSWLADSMGMHPLDGPEHIYNHVTIVNYVYLQLQDPLAHLFHLLLEIVDSLAIYALVIEEDR